MSRSRELLSQAADDVSAAIRSIEKPDLAASTPCREFTLQDLVDHFRGTTRLLIQTGRRGEESANQAAGEDWQAELTANLTELAAVWADPDAWHGTVSMGGGEMPASMIGDMVFAEILLHGWDITKAGGVALPVSQEVGAELRRGVEETAELGRTMGAYGAAVPVPEAAPDFDHALAAAGRDPQWRR